MLNLPPHYVEHLFTIRDTFQYSAARLQRGNESAGRVQRFSRRLASRANSSPTSISSEARRSVSRFARRPKTGVPAAVAGNEDRLVDSTARLVHGSAQPDDRTR